MISLFPIMDFYEPNNSGINQQTDWMDGVQQECEKPPCKSGSIAAIEDKIVAQYGIIDYHHNQIAWRGSRSDPVAQPCR